MTVEDFDLDDRHTPRADALGTAMTHGAALLTGYGIGTLEFGLPTLTALTLGAALSLLVAALTATVARPDRATA